MLILMAHGSRDPAWRDSVEAMVRELQVELGPDRVDLAYMDCAPPTLMDVARGALKRGVGRVQVLPIFLTTEGHVDRDVRPLVEEAQEALPGMDVVLLPPMGQQPEFRRALGLIAARTAVRVRPQPEPKTP